jgi:hypothetical protein
MSSFEYDQAQYSPASIGSRRPDGTFPPRWRQRIGYKKNWTPMSGENVAGGCVRCRSRLRGGGISPGHGQRRPGPHGIPDGAGILPRSAPISTPEADAQDVADRSLQAVRQGRATRCSWSSAWSAYMTPVGSTANIVHPRVNGGQGKLVRIIDAEIDAGAQEVTLVVWG